MDDRYSRNGQRDYGNRGEPQDYGRDLGSDRDYTHSSARDYAAAGEYGRRGHSRSDYGAGSHRDWGRDESRSSYGSGNYGGESYGREERYGAGSYGRGSDYDRTAFGGGGDRGGSGYSSQSRSAGSARGYDRGRDEDRGFFERAGDEVRSWFGDEEAERRREQDQRYDARQGREERGQDSNDDHYHSWRRERIAELDRDYDEYRQENSQRFQNEFSSWRTERQGQRDSLGRVTEHMDVVGSDGSHVGTVDKVRGDRIILTKNDADAGGHHHSIPSRWVQTVDDKVTLRKTADEAKSHWRDEERSGTESGQGSWSAGGNLNRSFSGTY